MNLLTKITRKVRKVFLPKLKVTPFTQKEYLGTLHYGACTVPKGIFNKDSICYTAGAGEDISFDLSLAQKYQADVYIIDPTPRAIQHFKELKSHTAEGRPMPINQNPEFTYGVSKENLKRVSFLPIGLWKNNEEMKFYAPAVESKVSHSIMNLQKSEKYFVATVERVSSLMKRLGHQQLDLLKMDIEGAEYQVLKTLGEDSIRPKVICVAYDEGTKPLDNKYMHRIKASVEGVCDLGYKLIHFEPGKFKTTFLRTDIYQNMIALN
ncbi:MAG: FkbM family methyltransferase [Bacteroidota bacterium]